MDTDQEIWRPVVGYEGNYEVSSLGRIRSVERVVYRRSKLGKSCPLFAKSKLRLFGQNWAGYQMVNLSVSGSVRNIAVHRLVAKAFCENPHGNPQVDHKDGNNKNNRSDNLEWVTGLENMRRSFRRGHYIPRGEQSPHAVLSERDVRLIRALNGVLTKKQIGDTYGVTESNIYAIISRRSWAHI